MYFVIKKVYTQKFRQWYLKLDIGMKCYNISITQYRHDEFKNCSSLIKNSKESI